MTTVSIKPEWLTPLHGESPEIACTFARLSISIDDIPVTRVLDVHSRTMRDGIHVPLFPLAEWLVAHWWHLNYEAPVPVLDEKQETYLERHSLRFVGEGFAWPDLQFIPHGETVQLIRRPRRPEFENVEFVAEGSSRIQRADLECALRDVIESVLERLTSTEVTSSLADDWNAVVRAGDEEQEFCRAAASLGLDPYSLTEADASVLEKAWNRLPPGLREDAVLASTLSILAGVSDWIHETASRFESQAPPANQWRSFKPLGVSAASPHQPWRRGYELARLAREHSHLGNRILIDPWDLDGFNVKTTEVEPAPSRGIDALGLVDPACGPACCTSKTRIESRRFVAARALYHHLSGRSSKFALVSAAETTEQQMSRAFAAEFLASARLLKVRLSHAHLGDDEIDEIAAEFGVSPMLVAHQIRNHGLGELAGDRYADSSP